MRASVHAIVFTMVALLATPMPGSAQSAPTGDIRGRVVNSASNTPLPGITVDVSVVGSQAIVGRSTTGTDGVFHVTALKPGRYHAHIRSLGYAPWDNPSIAVAASSVDLGTIRLTNVALQLESVAVREKRQDVQLAPDRNTYVVRDMPTAKGGNALDVLRTVPAVDVNIDNVVSLRGNSGVTIQINGRPSPLKPAQLGDFLAQIPADMVDKVEVVPNPSARDDPTGVAGIINIVLKQEADAGTTGGATVAGSTTGQANAGVNFGYDRKALSFYGSYGFLRDRRPRSEALFRENDYLTPLTFLDESSLRTQARQIHTLTGSAGYKLTSHDDVSLDLLFSARHDIETSGITYRALDSGKALTALTDRLSSGSNHENDFDGTLALKHAFADKGHKFSAELRANRHSEGGPSAIAAHDLSLSGAPFGTTDQEAQQNLERPSENSVRLDYIRPLASGLRVETGYKGAFDHFHTALDTRVLDTASGSYLLDAARTSDFQYQQDVNAGYAMLTGQRGKLQFQGGLRAEHAATQFRVAALTTPFDNSYNSVFPSGLLAYNIDDATQVKVSYSARIRRPDDADQLDPIAHYQDPLNLSRGNPYLKPEHTNAYELGLQRSMGKSTLQVTPFFRRTFDAVRTLRTIDSAGVTTRTFANIATSDAYGGDATLAVSGTRLSGFVGSSIFRQVTNATNVAPDLSIRTTAWRARANGAYRVSNTVDVQALFSYQAAMTVEQGTNGSRTQLNLAARQKFMDDQFSLTLRVIDPFDTSHERGTTIDPRFFQVSDRSRAVRGLLLSASWTFGKPEKGRDNIDLSGDGSPP
ncbi:MAG: TonB-dependent receptor [Gemmatimonadota bacterium]|nr:TonB-dependent receptor [Gemmatimonadota bacterium]